MGHRTAPAGPSAGDVLLSHLGGQVTRVRDQEPRVRADRPDSVHAMRVATRRLRSALRTFQPLLASPTRPLREDLRWLATELGAARDAEVLRDRVVTAVADLDQHHDLAAPQGTPGPGADAGGGRGAADVPAQVAAQLDSAYRAAHERVLEVLGSERYQRLLADLDELLASPALTPRAGRRATKVLPRHVARVWRTLDDLVEQARRAPAGPARDELLHEARKAAKQVRYAAEAVADVHGSPARRLAAAVTRVQEVLGEHQDSVLARQRLRDLARDATPEVAFVYGRLHAQEEARAVTGEAGLDEAWRAATKGRLHRWLR